MTKVSRMNVFNAIYVGDDSSKVFFKYKTYEINYMVCDIGSVWVTNVGNFNEMLKYSSVELFFKEWKIIDMEAYELWNCRLNIRNEIIKNFIVT
jgi:hypothetical protein